MNSIISAFLWSVGVFHFAFLVVYFSICLVLLPAERIYSMVRVAFNNQLRIMGVRIRIRGHHRFDHSRSFLIMGNHESLFDIFAIPVAIPMHIVAVEAAYHFNLPIWGFLVRKWGCIPIHRNDLNRAKKALKTAQNTFKRGTSILILPEGHRTMTGNLGVFKKGPFHLAKQAQGDILPFAISGLYKYKSKHSWKLNPTTITIRFGNPISYESFKESTVDQLRDRVRQTIMNLRENP